MLSARALRMLGRTGRPQSGFLSLLRGRRSLPKSSRARLVRVVRSGSVDPTSSSPAPAPGASAPATAHAPCTADLRPQALADLAGSVARRHCQRGVRRAPTVGVVEEGRLRARSLHDVGTNCRGSARRARDESAPPASSGGSTPGATPWPRDHSTESCIPDRGCRSSSPATTVLICSALSHQRVTAQTTGNGGAGRR